MDASKAFSEFIEHIEHSELNYVIHRTLFSAQISKKSMIKFHDNPLSFNEVKPNLKEDTIHAPEELKLKKCVVATNDKIDKLEETLNQEKSKLKSLDEEVKKETKELKLKLDQQENTVKTTEENQNQKT